MKADGEGLTRISRIITNSFFHFVPIRAIRVSPFFAAKHMNRAKTISEWLTRPAEAVVKYQPSG